MGKEHQQDLLKARFDLRIEDLLSSPQADETALERLL